MNSLEDIMKKHPFARRIVEVAMVLFMALYPLRHIHAGLDLWDTGYNYANFEYMGLDSMDPMWFFSTYLSTAVGHLLTLLPYGKTVLGLNFFTALSVSFLSVISYLFCTRIVKLPRAVTFIGEYVAISLCWCPTALLYNYLTYILLTVAVILIYYGLSNKKNNLLFVAGILLGLNVFVRFSNLPEAVLIVGVWAYGHLEVVSKIRNEKVLSKKKERRDAFKLTLIRTVYCILGYGIAVGGMLVFFGVRYGFGEYFAAIKRLFGMTSTATDYTAVSMLKGLIAWYKEAGYWLSRLIVFAIGGMITCALGKHIDVEYGFREDGGINPFGKKFSFLGLAYFVSVILALGSLVWLYKAHFCFSDYGGYGSVIMPGAVAALIAIVICLIQIFRPDSPLNNRLFGGLILLVILITPIGSNNGIYPVLNNLFLVGPYFINSVWRLIKIPEWRGAGRREYYVQADKQSEKIGVIGTVKSYISLFPIKAGLLVFCGLCLFQFTTFGIEFSFNKPDSDEEKIYTVSADKNMTGIRMGYEKARDYYGLYQYVTKAELTDRTLITYGYIPAVSFYLQMEPAFNPWIDLASYDISVLSDELDKIVLSSETDESSETAGVKEEPEVIKDYINQNEETADNTVENTADNTAASVYPVVIIAAEYAGCLPEEVQGLYFEEKQNTQDETENKNESAVQGNNEDADDISDDSEYTEDAKWQLLCDFFVNGNYRLKYINDTYAVLDVSSSPSLDLPGLSADAE